MLCYNSHFLLVGVSPQSLLILPLSYGTTVFWTGFLNAQNLVINYISYQKKPEGIWTVFIKLSHFWKMILALCFRRLEDLVMFWEQTFFKVVHGIYYVINLQACTSPMKRLETFGTGTHNDTWQCYGYSEAINKFLNEVTYKQLIRQIKCYII